MTGKRNSELRGPGGNQTIGANSRPDKGLEDSPSHDRLETDSHSIQSFALLF
jgi:hypothetical protein